MKIHRDTKQLVGPELRAHVPTWIKTAVAAIADSRMLRETDIIREALVEYLSRRGTTKPKNNQA